jgi:hypothetical protein
MSLRTGSWLYRGLHVQARLRAIAVDGPRIDQLAATCIERDRLQRNSAWIIAEFAP